MFKNFLFVLLIALSSCTPKADIDIQMAIRDLPIPDGLDSSLVADIRFINGLHATFEGDTQRPADSLQIAQLLDIEKRLKGKVGLSPIYLVRTRRLYAYNLQNEQLHDEAIAHLKETLRYFDGYEPATPADFYEYAYCNNLIGVSYDLTYNHPMSAHYHRASLASNLKHRFYIEAMKDYSNIAIYHENIGGYEKAQDLIDSAFLLANQYGDFLLNQNDSLAYLGCYHHAGVIAGRLGQKALMEGDTAAAKQLIVQSREYTLALLPQLEEMKQRGTDVTYFFIQSYANIVNYAGLLTYDSQALDTALYYNQRLAQATQGIPILGIYTMARRSFLLAEKGACDSAAYYAHQVIETLDGVQMLDVPVQTDLYIVSSRIDAIRALFNCAAGRADEAELAEIAAMSKATAKDFEQIIARTGTDNAFEKKNLDQYFFLSNAIAQYTRLYTLTGKDKYAEEALLLAEQDRDILLRKSLSRRSALRTWTGKRLELLQREQALRDNVNSLRAMGSDELQPAVERQSAFFRQLANSTDPVERSFYLERLNTEAISIAQIRKQLLDKDKAILSFHRQKQYFSVFVLTTDAIKYYEVPLDKKLTSAIQNLRVEFRKESNDLKNDAYIVYQQLLAPASEWLKKEGVTELMVIQSQYTQDFTLENLPTQRNPDETWNETPLFIDDFSCSYHASMTTLLASKTLQGLATTDLPPAKTWMGFSNVPPNMKPLDAMRQMSANIAKRFQPTGSGAFYDQIPAERLLSDLPYAHIAQLVVHGRINPEDPDDYALVIADKEKERLLRPVDIYGLNLQAKLAILLNCNSGSTRVDNSFNGRNSLARAFIYAGSQTVITGVDFLKDPNTAKIMERFYHHWMDAGQPAGLALTLAKRDFKNNNPTGHPYDWANLVLTGDPTLRYAAI